MAVSYNGLWKLLIDKNMKKVDMMNQVGISSSTVAKMTNGELVSMKILEKICDKLDCDFGDIIHYEKDCFIIVDVRGVSGQCTGFPFLTEDRIEPCQYDK